MLRFYTGENQDAKLSLMASQMKKDLADGREVLAIVPDQFSFAFDKSLYGCLGAKDFNRITVLSFKRLSQALLDKHGSREGVAVDQAVKLSLIWLAIRKVKSENCLKVLARSLDKPNFVTDMASTFDAMKHAAITPELLMNSAESLPGTLGDKLHDISLLLAAYNNELSVRRLRDDSTLITEGACLADINRDFKCKVVYLDRFDAFSPDELMMLRILIRDAKSVNVALMLPNNAVKSISSPYKLTLATQNRLAVIAKECSSPIEFFSDNNCEWSRSSIADVRANLFTHSAAHNKSDGGVNICSCDTIYAEADLVAASIRDLVRSGYTYNDICVFTHDIRSYGRILESSFEKYSVPCFFDSHESAGGMSLVIYALSALEAVSTRTPSTEKILKLVRSPFFMLDETELSLIEDYTLRWNVDGGMWLDDFTAKEKYTDLEGVNAVRRKIITPLSKFRESVINANATEISAAFSRYLADVCLTDGAKNLIALAPDTQKVELSRLLKRLWQTLIDSVTAISRTLGEDKLSVSAYTELLRLIISSVSLSSPPQKLECVTVADVSRSIVNHPKVVFIVGVNDGHFPGDIKRSGLFSGKDVALLEEQGLTFQPTMSASLDTERLDCHKALCAPTDLLFLSYSGCDVKGTPLRPSPYINRICKLLGISPIKASSLSPEFYCSSPAAAYSRYALGENMTSSQRASVYDVLLSLPEYERKLRALALAGKDNRHSLSPDVAQKLFAYGDVNVTASRIDVYNKCNFEYFCKYGLGIEDVRPVNMDPNVRGTVMHFIFESVLDYYKDGFEQADDDELFALILRLLEQYSASDLCGDFGKSAKFKADYNRLADICFDILKNIREEYKVSKFRPVRFEYDLQKEDKKSVLTIPINDRMKISLRGVVDRVDVYTDENGQSFLRILDYKTGEKKLSFDDIYNGLNLQMLLYMLALTEGTDKDFNSCRPAGIVYMHAGFFDCDDDYDPISPQTKDRLKSVNKQLKRDGLIVGDYDLISAMDADISGHYVPVTVNKDGRLSAKSRTVSETAFKALESFARRKVYEFGKSLLIGKIDAVPLGRGDNDLPCNYCDYTSVCDRRKYMIKLIGKDDDKKLMEEIGGGADAKVD